MKVKANPLSKTHEKRILDFATWLKKRVPEAAFDFCEIMYVPGDAREPLDALKAGGGCGTVGCACGWLPAYKPRVFEWDGAFYSRTVRDTSSGESGIHAPVRYFGITNEEADFLFFPDAGAYVSSVGEIDEFTGDFFIRSPCGGDASPADVAANLRRFVNFRKTGRIPKEWL